MVVASSPLERNSWIFHLSGLVAVAAPEFLTRRSKEKTIVLEGEEAENRVLEFTCITDTVLSFSVGII